MLELNKKKMFLLYCEFETVTLTNNDIKVVNHCYISYNLFSASIITQIKN